MLNQNEIMQTIQMIDQQHLDVRTITMGISLLSCARSDPKAACDAIYDKITRYAENLVATGEAIEKEFGIPIVNKRISVTPIALVAAAADTDNYAPFAVLRGAHPNTAVLRLTGASGRKLEVVGASIGGGRINICQIDGITTNFGGDHNTLIVHNQDTPGHVAAVTTCLSQHGVNIATMQLYRSTAGGYAVMVLECDEPIPDEIAGQLGSQPGIVKVTILNL